MNLTDALEENRKLRKINRVLMERVERSTDAQGNAFSLFQTAIVLEKLVQQRTGELQAANVVAARAKTGGSNLFASASHDLLEPLNIARLFLAALAGRQLDAESARMVERVGEALASAETLLSALLEMSRFDAGTLRPEREDFPIDLLLRRLARAYAGGAEERGLRLRVVPCDAIVRSDPQLLERVLRNLTGNALRYTDAGGVLVGCRARGSVLRIEVWDTGAGIPAESLDAVFEEFHRLRAARDGEPGMGLGLAIVRRIARLLEHPVDVRSRLGRGSVFGVEVPLARAVRGLRSSL